MTEPPQEGERRPEPGAPQPYGPAAQSYGEPTSSGVPDERQHEPRPIVPPGWHPSDFNRPYGSPPAGPAPSGPQGSYGVPDQFTVPPGPAPETPARRPRTRLIALLVALLVLAVAVLVAALTLGPRILSREAVERDVARQFEELNGVPIDIECPDDMVLESGAEFTCTGETDEGEEVEIAIAVTDPPGDAEYTWTEI